MYISNLLSLSSYSIPSPGLSFAVILSLVVSVCLSPLPFLWEYMCVFSTSISWSSPAEVMLVHTAKYWACVMAAQNCMAALQHRFTIHVAHVLFTLNLSYTILFEALNCSFFALYLHGRLPCRFLRVQGIYSDDTLASHCGERCLLNRCLHFSPKFFSLYCSLLARGTHFLYSIYVIVRLERAVRLERSA